MIANIPSISSISIALGITLLAANCLAILTGFTIISYSFGQLTSANPPLSVNLDKSIYGIAETEIVMVNGSLDTSLLRENQTRVLLFQLFGPNGNLVRVDQVPILVNGTFVYEFPLGGLQNQIGIYTVRLTFDGKTQAETTFNYDYLPLSCESFGGSDNSSGQAGSGGQYSSPRTIFIENHAIRYIGFIRNITVDAENNSLLLNVTGHSTTFNCLVIYLPREIIDAVNLDNNTAIDFVVNADGNPTSTAERYRNDNGREMVIHFSDNTKIIQIIGTRVIPEFGSIAMLVAAILLAVVVFISARLRLSR